MGSTSTTSGSGTSPVSAFTGAVFLGIGISIVVFGRLLQYMYDMGQRSSAVGGRVLAANPGIAEQNQTNGIASSSSTDETATTTSTDVATLLLSPPNNENLLEVIVQSPQNSSTDEIAISSTSAVLTPTNVVAFEVATSESASSSSGYQPVAHLTVTDVLVTTYSMVADAISLASSF